MRKKWYFVKFQDSNSNIDTDTIDAPNIMMARLWFMDNRPAANIIFIKYINF